jgi:hypothetical protein
VVSDSIAREIIGHDSAAISRLYTNIDTPTQEAALAKMEDFTGKQDLKETGMDQIEFLQQPNAEFPTLAFRFAKTMREHPHAYVVRSRANEDDHTELFHRIGEEGVWEEWKG